jgi:hypothetical protein
MTTTIHTFINDDARKRAEEALEFYGSDARAEYSNQRLGNDKSDVTVSLVAGIEKLKLKSKDFINSIVQN